MNACDGDEGKECLSEVLKIFGETTIASEPGEGAFDHPAAWQHGEPFYVVCPLHDLDPQTRDLGDRDIDLMGVVDAIRPDQFEPRKAMAYPIDHQHRAITILDVRRMHNYPERQAFSVNQRMDLAPLDLLSSIVAYAAIMAAPFSADLID